jgi:hypothetical protein
MKCLAIMLVTTFLVTNARSQALLELPAPTPAPPAAESTAAATTPPVLPEPASRQQFKILSKAALKEVERDSAKQTRAESVKLPVNPDAPKRPAAENIQRLEEIRVFGNTDPEDYTAPKPAPMLVFRANLEKQRPMTPKQITQLGLCFIGLCGIYGPEGIPVEASALDRAEDRKNATTVELSRARGTLQ